MRDAVEKTLSRNSYFAHPENILLAALTDNNLCIRKDAANKIMLARQMMQGEAQIRKFSKTQIFINFDATTYYDMIDWESLPSEELLQQVELGPISFPSIPYPTQAVERAVKEVSRASSKLYGHEARHGMIVAAEESRRRLKKLEAKKHFNQ